MDIDLVYLWVDGNDPVWAAKRDQYIGKPAEMAGNNCEGRYADNDELMFSLRSVGKYAPWLHRIFIVTDNQVPHWLDSDNKKIRIVDHSEIMPAECLPCFNSAVIEHFLYNIPGLSEHFVYANDDMLLNKPVTPDTFFGADGLPIVRLNLRLFRNLHLFIKTKIRGKTLSAYNKTILNSAMLVKEKYGVSYSSKTHHNMDAYLKSDYRRTREMFSEAIDATLLNRARTDKDVQRNLYTFVARAEKRAHVKYVTQKTSFRLHIDNHKHYDKFFSYNPTFLCVNDSEHANDDDRRIEREFLSNLFPEKSEFEK